MLLVVLGACGGSDAEPTGTTGGEARFPDIVGVELTEEAGGTYRVAVTVSSPYDSPDRYADAWRVRASDGRELAIRELTHDHADEQPFTRDLTGVEIPPGVDEITVEARDSVNGWGGASATASVPGR